MAGTLIKQYQYTHKIVESFRTCREQTGIVVRRPEALGMLCIFFQFVFWETKVPQTTNC